jgi:hypothetical protein
MVADAGRLAVAAVAKIFAVQANVFVGRHGLAGMLGHCWLGFAADVDCGQVLL